ncbi:MAG: hypothetical protein KGK07_10595 [Chloroflexota bacterium]|nr:hypothetical protein [Chloroflexota bacterium]
MMADFPLMPPGTPQQWQFGDLSLRAQRQMADAAIYTYENLCECTEAQLRGIGGLDDACMAEVHQRLAERRLFLAEVSADPSPPPGRGRVGRASRPPGPKPRRARPPVEQGGVHALIRLDVRFLLALGRVDDDAQARLARQYHVDEAYVGRLVREEMAKRRASRSSTPRSARGSRTRS